MKLFNEFVEMYCKHFNLDVRSTKYINWVCEGEQVIGHFSDNEKIISFKNGTTVRKGDLLLSILEGANLHN